MRTFAYVLAAALCVSTAALADPKPGKPVKSYASAEGERVDVVPIEGDPRQALVRFSGVGGSFEGKVFLVEVTVGEFTAVPTQCGRTRVLRGYLGEGGVEATRGFGAVDGNRR